MYYNIQSFYLGSEREREREREREGEREREMQQMLFGGNILYYPEPVVLFSHYYPK